MFPLMMFHGFDFFALLMISTGTNKKTVAANWNKYTHWAWSGWIGGNMTWNCALLVVWAFSFIESSFFQQSMFWTFVVAFGLNAIYLIMIDVFFIVGGAMAGGDIWYNLYMVLINTFITLGYHGILIYALGPQIAAFYRWHDQDWWTFGNFLKNGTMDDDEIDAFD